MVSKKMEKALNDQLNAELYSSYLYLSMSACFSMRNLHGFAHWMKLQSQEEYGHAMKFYAHLLERGNKVALKAIDAVPTDWASPLAAFKDTLAHEEKVTSLINDIMGLAVTEKDYATQGFLDWFIKEQVEEEASAGEILQKLNFIKDAPGGLLFLDRELAARGRG